MKKILLISILILCLIPSFSLSQSTPMRFKIMDRYQKITIAEGEMTALSMSNGTLLILSSKIVSATIKIKVDGVEKEYKLGLTIQP